MKAAFGLRAVFLAAVFLADFLAVFAIWCPLD
jgi:hypothetical protein